MASAATALNDLLETLAGSIDQDLVSPRTLKYILLIATFAFACLGIVMESKTRRKMSIMSSSRLLGRITGDILFILLGIAGDFLAERYGKKRITFTILLLPTGNRSGLILGFLLDLCFSPYDTSYVFRLGFLVPLFISPIAMFFVGEPIDETMLDPVLGGVPILAYLLVMWCSYNTEGAMAIMTNLWENRILIAFWAVYISMVAWWNLDLCYYVVYATLWLLTKPFYILLDSIINPMLELLGTKLAARQRKRWSYTAIYPEQGMFYEPYRYRPLKEGEFRLLKLWPRGPFDKICCELGEMPFDVAKSKYYEAMSYTWGDRTRTHSITLEGHEFKVTKSAYDVLCDHSSLWKHQFIWIDSICINQQDNIERGQQVMIMKSIYQKAYRTVVYLGNGPNSHLAVNLLKELRLFREYCPTGEELFSKYHSEIESERWLALKKLLCHAWFERVWIIQEVVIADSVVVRIGGRSISWDTFICAIRLLKGSDAGLLLIGPPLEGVSPSQSPLSHISHIELLAKSREDQRKKKITSFEDVMYRYPTFKATDDRDKVYALLGCISDAAGIPKNVLADYNKPLEDVYLDTANALLSSKDPTLLFAHTGIGWDRKYAELPSWVPDWTSVDGPSTLGGPNCGYNAAGRLPFVIRPGPNPKYSKCLVIRHVDSITENYVSWPRRQQDDLNILHFPSGGDPLLHQRHMYRWVMKVIGLTAIYTNYPNKSPENIIEVVGRTLIGDMRAWQKEPAGAEFVEHFKDWMAVHTILNDFEDELPSIAAGQPASARLDAALEARFGPKTGTSGPSTLSRSMNPAKWMVKAAMVCTWRAFCVTNNGYIGLVPQKSLPGDIVAIVPGIRTPIILRPLQTRMPSYQIVGECYIHGIMDGEMATFDQMRAVAIV